LQRTATRPNHKPPFHTHPSLSTGRTKIMADNKDAAPPTATTSTPPKVRHTDLPISTDNANPLADNAPVPTLTNAIKSVKLEDFATVHQKPCTRQAFLVGIGSGFAFGGIKLILRCMVTTVRFCD